MAMFYVSLFVGIFAGFSSYAKSPDQIYRENVDGVVYIRNFLPNGNTNMGSGVLVDAKRRLVLTNHHVMGGETRADVFFLARNSKGETYLDRDFYDKNAKELKGHSLRTGGKVIASSPRADLVVLELADSPSYAKALQISEDIINLDDRVHLIGHPAGRDLWRWSMGSVRSVENLKDTDHNTDFIGISLFASVYHGNSGGALLNDDGGLIGIVQAMCGRDGVEGRAIHRVELKYLLDSIRKQYFFSVANDTAGKVYFAVKDCFKETQQSEIEPGKHLTYRCDTDAPKVFARYDGPQGAQFERTWNLSTYSALMGNGVNPTRKEHAREYGFKWYEGHLVLFDQEDQKKP